MADTGVTVGNAILAKGRLEQIRGSAVGQICGRFVVVAAAKPGECMINPRIMMQGDVAVFRKRLGNFCL